MSEEEVNNILLSFGYDDNAIKIQNYKPTNGIRKWKKVDGKRVYYIEK